MRKDVNPLTPLESKAPKLSKPKNSAAGIPALISTARYGLGNMGVLNSLKNLAKLNDFNALDNFVSVLHIFRKSYLTLLNRFS